MSSIIYTTVTSGPKWSAPAIIFTSTGVALGALAVRQGRSFGASSSSVVLGPDTAMPGGQTNNPPTAMDYPWSNPPTFGGGPVVPFNQDGTYRWIRGHLVNGRWGGTGSDWRNLVPLTETANVNQASVEAYMDRYLANSLSYEDAVPHKACWYGVYYVVQCSANPFAAAPTASNNLYSYAPEFVRISWRAVSVVKPVNVAVANAAANPLMAGAPVAVPNLPFPAPAPPQIAGWPVAVLPAGSAPGGAVLGALPAGFPPQQPNGFDGSIEIHQS